MACTTGCITRDCESYAACLRSKSTGVFGVDISKGREATDIKAWDRNLDAYKAARAQGIQPASTARSAVDNAVKISDATGVAYQG